MPHQQTVAGTSTLGHSSPWHPAQRRLGACSGWEVGPIELLPVREPAGIHFDIGWGLLERVQVESAYIPGAKFAFVHRSHSGRFGMVNSEEDYQNLRRFLFGDLEVTADLIDYALPGEPDETVTWQAETRLSVRGLPIVMHEQLAAHHCPIQLERPKASDTADKPVPLVTTFLKSRERPSDTPTMRYLLQLRIISLKERDGIFTFRHHLEQSADFDDMLVVDVEPPGEDRRFPRAWGRWASEIATTLHGYQPADDDLLEDRNPQEGIWETVVPLPAPSGDFLGPKARIHLTVSSRATLALS